MALHARAREELRGWKAEIVTVNRSVDGAVSVKTLPGFFNTRDEALAAAQNRIDRKTAAPPEAEPADAPALGESNTFISTGWAISAEEDE